MEKKQKVILIIVAGIILVILLIIFLVFFNKKDTKVIPNNSNNNNKVDVVPKPITKIQNERSSILNTARGFIEIYGTYTNTNNYSNIKELYPFMMDNMIAKYEKIILNAKDNPNYFSKTTKVLDIALSEYKDGDLKATVKISVVEKNLDATSSEKVSSKNYVVSMTKDDDKWKVSEVK